MRQHNIHIDDIQVGERHRALSVPAVERLAQSMQQIGLRQPISVRLVDEMEVAGEMLAGAPVLVVGHHRLAAAKHLGWTHIDCIEVDDDQLRAELWEIDENLMRAELSPAQQAEHLGRRKEVWEALQASGKTFPTKERFASTTAKATGETKRNVNLQVARAEALGSDLKLVAGTSLDKGVELDALAKMHPAERAPIIARAVAGEAVTARAPIRDDDAIEKQVDAVMAAWNKAGPEARERVRDLIDRPVFDRTRAGVQ